MSAVKLQWPTRIIAGVLFALAAGPAAAVGVVPPIFVNQEIGKYLLIGMGPVNTINAQPGVGQAENTNNFELGANKAPTPSYSGFANDGSSSGGTSGPTIRAAAPNIPEVAKTVEPGVYYDGNIAITNKTGVFNLQNVGVYADPNWKDPLNGLGIRCANSKAACDAGTQNSFFNDGKFFPNTFTRTGDGGDLNNNVDGYGSNVNPGAADQSTRIDKKDGGMGQVGVTGNVDFTLLLKEIDFLKTEVPKFAATATITINDGKLDKETNTFTVTNDLNFDDVTMTDATISDGRGGKSLDNMNRNGLTTINLAHGLNIIDIITGGSDFVLQESSLVIDGYDDSYAIFRMPDNANFKTSNANILVGNGGIGLNNVVFHSDKLDNNAHFALSNTVINGVALRTVGHAGGEINFQNVQGCTQVIADKINLSNVRIHKCGGGTNVPEPASLLLLVAGLAGLGFARRRAKR